VNNIFNPFASAEFLKTPPIMILKIEILYANVWGRHFKIESAMMSYSFKMYSVLMYTDFYVDAAHAAHVLEQQRCRNFWIKLTQYTRWKVPVDETLAKLSTPGPLFAGVVIWIFVLPWSRDSSPATKDCNTRLRLVFNKFDPLKLPCHCDRRYRTWGRPDSYDVLTRLTVWLHKYVSIKA